MDGSKPAFKVPTAAEVREAAAKRQKTNLFVPSSASGGPKLKPAPDRPPPPAPERAPAQGPRAAPCLSVPAYTSSVAPAQRWKPAPGAAGASVASSSAAANTSAATAASSAAGTSSSAGGAGAGTAAPGNPNAIIVSRRQQGNPVLKAIRNVPWGFGETTADYQLSETTCALFLSLRYHLLYPDYLLRRLRELSPAFSLRLVLLLIDSDDAERPVLQVTRAATTHDATAVLAWSVPEAARYLETFRAYARKPADMIRERSDGSFLSQLTDVLTTVRPLNKTDVATLHATFGSLHSILHASQQQLALCPGLGERKVQRLREAFLEPFVPPSARGIAAAPRPPSAAAADEVEGAEVAAAGEAAEDAAAAAGRAEEARKSEEPPGEPAA